MFNLQYDSQIKTIPSHVWKKYGDHTFCCQRNDSKDCPITKQNHLSCACLIHYPLAPTTVSPSFTSKPAIQAPLTLNSSTFSPHKTNMCFLDSSLFHWKYCHSVPVAVETAQFLPFSCYYVCLCFNSTEQLAQYFSVSVLTPQTTLLVLRFTCFSQSTFPFSIACVLSLLH